jgi:hypothetical protein
MGLTVTDGKIIPSTGSADPECLSQVDLAVLDD